MIRRSFRVGLWLGLLLGVLFALLKTLQGQRDNKELAAPPEGRWKVPAPPVSDAVVAGAADIEYAQVVHADVTEEVEAVEPEVEIPGPTAPAPPPPAAPAAPSASWAEEPWTDDLVPAASADTDETVETEEEPAPRRRREVKSPPSPSAKRTPSSPPPAAGKARKATKRPARLWVEPTGDVCPKSHPVKAKMASGLFHLPGMLNYSRTHPDRCYASEDAAVADGLTKSKR